MSRKSSVPIKTRKKIKKLASEGKTPAELAKMFDVSYSVAWVYSKFDSFSDYQTSLAREKGFNTFGEYQQHLLRKRGFKSTTEYLNALAEENFNSHNDYLEYLANLRGFKTRREYQKHLEEQRKKRLENKALSYFITKRLEELGKTKAWLAKEIGCTNQTVRKYARGVSIPDEAGLKKIFRVLGATHSCLDDVVEDISLILLQTAR